MFVNCKRQIIIKCTKPEYEQHVGNIIHEQLKGNTDYVINNIILNLSRDRYDKGTENELHIYFFKDCKMIPDIELHDFDSSAINRITVYNHDENTCRIIKDMFDYLEILPEYKEGNISVIDSEITMSMCDNYKDSTISILFNEKCKGIKEFMIRGDKYND